MPVVGIAVRLAPRPLRVPLGPPAQRLGQCLDRHRAPLVLPVAAAAQHRQQGGGERGGATAVARALAGEAAGGGERERPVLRQRFQERVARVAAVEDEDDALGAARAQQVPQFRVAEAVRPRSRPRSAPRAWQQVQPARALGGFAGVQTAVPAEVAQQEVLRLPGGPAASRTSVSRSGERTVRTTSGVNRPYASSTSTSYNCSMFARTEGSDGKPVPRSYSDTLISTTRDRRARG
ncbi:hypothetical protein MTQ13_24680 [Streptomyces sp. XM4011]|uniref:hypothetical protein n=1 Tax=Streptomyces sp. XM4011 TaxID=2929780 RepID=UPI001FF8522A|nr:hypothetical protein [Streptomyces sp. XM4011]MCK1817438.1 hypothetical protein [Streptomyces sp. XM4011]